ncbi:MAG: isoprenylcysteine carboxylmethyltransferase family protein [bacterium]|nr:isoprenylcysteine carboxylmethyltransferase family protein [Candidatus Limimorpha caballi]
MKDWIKSVFILPFNVTVVIPFLILYFTNFEYETPNVVQTIAGLLLLATGLFLAIWTMVLFNKIGKGTLAPWAATKHLIVEGPYKITRNPMITGILAILGGEALVTNTLFILYWLILFFIINCIYFKFYEEKDLERKFGDEYRKYRKKVPMWFPRIRIKGK